MGAKLSTIPTFVTLIGLLLPDATWAQTTINVSDGETLLVSHLQAGNFLGTPFTLGPNTTFEINNGGQFGERGTGLYDNTLDYAGLVMNVNAGGRFSNCINPGCGIVSNLHLNMFDGGAISSILQMGNGTIANIHGGSLGRVIAEEGSTLNLLGGDARTSVLRARPGSTLRIAGGGIRNIDAPSNSDVALIGGEFKLNGVDYAGSTISLEVDDVFTGTLQDGTIAIIRAASGVDYADIELERVSLLPTASMPYVIDGTQASTPMSFREGETLVLRDGGQIGRLTSAPGIHAVGTAIAVEGGILGQSSTLVDATVTVTGGEIGNHFTTFHGTTVTVTGGIFHSDVFAGPGSIWNIYDGDLGSFFAAADQSVVTIYGGNLGSAFTALPGSVSNIHGGTMTDLVLAGGTTSLFVTSASLNGAPLTLEAGAPLEITQRSRDLTLDVILADGSPLSIRLDPFQGKGPAPFVHPDATLLLVRAVPEPGTLVLAGAMLLLGTSRRMSVRRPTCAQGK